MPRTRVFAGNSCEICGRTIPANGTSTAQQRKARFCSMTCRRAASTSRELTCEQCSKSFSAAATRERARFCSVACRSAAGRRDVTCEYCGKATSFKADRAKRQRFCNRACMFAALGCAVCSKIRPGDRQAAGDKFCSDECAVTAHLEDQAAQTGHIFAVCSGCKRMRPGDDFTKDKTSRNRLAHECKDCARGYYEQNKDRYRLWRYLSRAAQGGIVVEFAQKAARFSLWGGRCWMCGIEGATQDDHVKPIVEGGSHCLSNLRPICRSCNSSKGGRWPLVPDKLLANFRHPNPRPGRDQEIPRRRRVEWTCPQCKSAFLIRAHEADSRKHCSQRCSTEARRARFVAMKCLNPLCGKDFELPDRKGTSERMFCSIECAWIARDRPAHWGGIADGQLRLF